MKLKIIKDFDATESFYLENFRKNIFKLNKLNKFSFRRTAIQISALNIFF
jgi:hypothetical protein